jgi:DNA polymerase-3 subunit gamma/tau
MGAALSAGSLSRLWQMLLKALGETRAAPDPAAAVEMCLIRLAYAADLPGPEEALKALREGASVAGAPTSGGRGGGGGARASLARVPEPAPAVTYAAPASFEDVAALIDARRDIGLRLDVEKFVRPVSFRPGAIEFEPAAGAPANLAQRLSARLKEWTGQPWLVVAQGGGGAETLMERQNRDLAAAHAGAMAEPFVQAVLATFPGTEILEVRQIATVADSAESDENED